MGNPAYQAITKDLVIVRDDAGQLNILRHALCWIHTERMVHTMIPLNGGHREDIAKVRGQIRDFYADLKAYKAGSTEKQNRIASGTGSTRNPSPCQRSQVGYSRLCQKAKGQGRYPLL